MEAAHMYSAEYLARYPFFRELLPTTPLSVMHDSLTGLYNRRHLLNYLENSIWARRNDFYLAMLDIDDFKKIISRFVTA